MAICSRCSSAIQQLRPHDWQSERKERNINVKLPIFGHAGIRGCWICFKFSKWLEAENPKLFKEWGRRALQVKFIAFGRMYIEQPQQDVLLPFFMNISPSGQEEDDATCQIELNFMSATGTIVPAFPIRVKLTGDRVFQLYTHRAKTPYNCRRQSQRRQPLDWYVHKGPQEM